MTATQPVIPIWLFFLIVGIALLIVALLILLMEYGPDVDRARADDLLPTDDETVEQYADRTLSAFTLPELDEAEIQRLRAIARIQASEIKS